MKSDTLRAMLRALPDVKEDGNALLFDPGWEVTLHAGRNGQTMSVQLVTRIALEAEYVVIETHKGQRFVWVLDDVRGIGAEPSSADRRTGGRKTGFV